MCFLLPLLICFHFYGKFPLTLMKKVKVGLYWYLTAGNLTERFYKCLLSSPPPNKKLYKFHILICCHGIWKSKMLNYRFIAVHSGEHCGLWASGFFCITQRIPFNFLFWKIITIVSTTDDRTTHSEIVKLMNAQMKNFEAIGNWCTVKWMTQKTHQNIDFSCCRQLIKLLSQLAIN